MENVSLAQVLITVVTTKVDAVLPERKYDLGLWLRIYMVHICSGKAAWAYAPPIIEIGECPSPHYPEENFLKY